MATTFSNSINDFYADTQTPYVHSFNVGFQRTLSKNMVVEARYVGTRARGGWVDGGRNINELNLIDNGWMTEFQHAQANYLINEQTYGWNIDGGQQLRVQGPPGPVPAADLPGVLQRPAGQPGRRHVEVHVEQLHELDPAQPPGADQPERQRPGRRDVQRLDDARQRHQGGLPGQLLLHEPGHQRRGVGDGTAAGRRARRTSTRSRSRCGGG